MKIPLLARVRSLAWELALPIVLVVVWWFASDAANSVYFPPLQKILVAFWQNWFVDYSTSDVLPSLGRLAIGYALAVVLGIVFGAVLGFSRPLRDVIEPLVSFLRSTPSAALVPLAVLIFGINSTMQIFLIAFYCVWPVLLNTIDGIGDVDRAVVDTARAFQVSGPRRVYLMLMSASPRIVAGMRVSLAAAVIVMLISEMFASVNGVGYVTINAQRTFRLVDVWSGLLFFGVLGYVLNFVFERVERHSMKWYFQSKGTR
ncbi:ABC transporter permease [soil metagenome]